MAVVSVSQGAVLTYSCSLAVHVDVPARPDCAHGTHCTHWSLPRHTSPQTGMLGAAVAGNQLHTRGYHVPEIAELTRY